MVVVVVGALWQQRYAAVIRSNCKDDDTAIRRKESGSVGSPIRVVVKCGTTPP